MIYQQWPDTWQQRRDLKPVGERGLLHPLDSPNILDGPPDNQLSETDLIEMEEARVAEEARS